MKVSTVFMQLAAEQCKQAGFACTIAPHKPDVFARVDGGGHAVEHDFRASAQGNVLEGDHPGIRKKHTRVRRVAYKTLGASAAVNGRAVAAAQGGCKGSIVP